MVKVGTDLSGTMLRGVLPEEENKVSDIDAHIKAGSFDSLKAGTYNIVIGNELAESLGVTIGDKIDLMVPQASVTPAGVSDACDKIEFLVPQAVVTSAGMVQPYAPSRSPATPSSAK